MIAVPRNQFVCGAVAGRIAAAVEEADTLSVAQRSRHLDVLARRWWQALETAGSALRAATPYLSDQELAERSRRLAEERRDVAGLLQGLAHDLQTDSGFVRWLAAPTSP